MWVIYSLTKQLRACQERLLQGDMQPYLFNAIQSNTDSLYTALNSGQLLKESEELTEPE
jgi:hypothetical protein